MSPRVLRPGTQAAMAKLGGRLNIRGQRVEFARAYPFQLAVVDGRMGDFSLTDSWIARERVLHQVSGWRQGLFCASPSNSAYAGTAIAALLAFSTCTLAMISFIYTRASPLVLSP